MNNMVHVNCTASLYTQYLEPYSLTSKSSNIGYRLRRGLRLGSAKVWDAAGIIEKTIPCRTMTSRRAGGRIGLRGEMRVRPRIRI